MNTETKHTPGPWIASLDTVSARHAGTETCELVARCSVTRMRSVTGMGGHPYEVGLANARLIAAAPALLKALQAISCLMDTDKVVDARRIALAALAKAGGAR